MKIVDLKQGSDEWLDWRRRGIGASEGPMIMGVSPYGTPYRLWLEKTYQREPQRDNPAMLRGRELEPAAREAYISLTGNPMLPVCMEMEDYPFIKASLDGFDFFSGIILEIKCPGIDDHALALTGQVPYHYWVQMQQQLMVSGCTTAHYWSFDGEQGVLLVVNADAEFQSVLLKALIEFNDCVLTRKPPAGDQWAIAARIWLNASDVLTAASAAETNAREMLIELLPDSGKQESAGVMASKVTKKGSVDWLGILGAAGFQVELESLVRKFALEQGIIIVSDDNWQNALLMCGIQASVADLVRYYAGSMLISIDEPDDPSSDEAWLACLSAKGHVPTMQILVTEFALLHGKKIVSAEDYRKPSSVSYRIQALKDAKELNQAELVHVDSANQAANLAEAELNFAF